jgi:hypothetical protein
MPPLCKQFPPPCNVAEYATVLYHLYDEAGLDVNRTSNLIIYHIIKHSITLL